MKTIEDVLQGVQHILAERVSETAEIRAAVRVVLWETGKLITLKSANVPEGQGMEYKDYFQFAETVRHIPPHRILAINRGEKEGVIKTRLEWDAEAVRRLAAAKLPLNDHPHAEFLHKVAEDAFTRLLLPSLEREIRRELTDEAEEHAVRVFARNLRCLLLQPPLFGRRVLAIDPGFRTGCKLAALDEVGNLLEEAVIFPFGKGERGRGREGKRAKQEQSAPAAAAGASASPATSQESAVPETSANAPATPIEATAPAHAEAAADAASTSTADSGATVPPTVTVPPSAPPESATSSPVSIAKEAAAETSLPAGATPEPAAAGPSGDPNTVSAAAPAEPAAPAVSPRAEAKAKLQELVGKHQLSVVAIGNGTACRDIEEIVSELIAESLAELVYVIVNEAGASVYSTSAIGREEFPNYDATTRGTVSIGRRLQDPLSELVKVDPQSIGVGLYQHDIHPRRLKDSLEAVIESCVNHVGGDLNTGSVPLFRHVSGLNQLAARELVDYRKQHGPFRSREQILQVPNIGPARYVQAAGFLKLRGGDNPLDQTWVHPENYPAVQQLLGELGASPEALNDRQETAKLHDKLKGVSCEELSGRLQLGIPTLRDIIEALSRPGRDPREELPPPIFRKGILKLEDLHPGMELKGTVLNVVDFGAFVDIGLKDSGLVHISQMANRYVKNPYDIASVGDVVAVWVLTVDHERRRVSLTMIKPATERRGPERKPEQPREQQAARAPRDRRPPPARHQDIAVPRQGQSAASAAAAAGATVAAPRPGTAAPPAPSRPPPRPRKPHRAPAKPRLSKAALEGEAPLRTFSELKAYFDAQRHGAAPPLPADQAENKPVQ